MPAFFSAIFMPVSAPAWRLGLLGRRADDRDLRKRRFDALTEDNQRFIIKLENLLLLDQQRQTKK